MSGVISMEGARPLDLTTRVFQALDVPYLSSVVALCSLLVGLDRSEKCAVVIGVHHLGQAPTVRTYPELSRCWSRVLTERPFEV